MAYRVNGLTAATVATDAHAVCALWNPHATQRIKVVEISLVALVAPGAGAGVELRRITTRGTAGSTVTPAIQQHDARGIAPPSGALLDLAAYTVQPTLEAGGLWAWILGAVIGSGFIYPMPLGLVIPPGSGVALINRAAIVVPSSEVTYVWQEHDD
jgi:hypothetical protein